MTEGDPIVRGQRDHFYKKLYIQQVLLYWLVGGTPLANGPALAAIVRGKLQVDLSDKERQMGYAATALLGYAMSPKRFREVCAERMGIRMSEEVAVKMVQTYRTTHMSIVDAWLDLENAIRAVINTLGSRQVLFGGRVQVRTEKTGSFWTLLVRVPSGQSIIFERPRVELIDGRSSIVAHSDAHGSQRIWGGLVMETICQALHATLANTGCLEPLAGATMGTLVSSPIQLKSGAIAWPEWARGLFP